NVGALLRTADAVGAAAVILTGAGTDVENPNVIRASQGSVFAVPVHVSSAAAAVDRLRSEGFRLVAASPRAGRAHWEADLTGAVALLLGAEDRGLPAELEAAADELITVPMRSRAADSPNVSVAGAGVLDDGLRRRSTQAPDLPAGRAPSEALRSRSAPLVRGARARSSPGGGAPRPQPPGTSAFWRRRLTSERKSLPSRGLITTA